MRRRVHASGSPRVPQHAPTVTRDYHRRPCQLCRGQRVECALHKVMQVVSCHKGLGFLCGGEPCKRRGEDAGGVTPGAPRGGDRFRAYFEGQMCLAFAPQLAASQLQSLSAPQMRFECCSPSARATTPKQAQSGHGLSRTVRQFLVFLLLVTTQKTAAEQLDGNPGACYFLL